MQEEAYMRRAIELAKKAEGFTNPNPMVGCVIVKDGVIIGEGYHRRYGELHAERNAIAACTQDPEGAVVYVTLEPCCHYGKTPPCTQILIEKKVARVVIGSRDPNPLVSGKGAALLRENGIEVEEDFLRDECDAINPVFFHYITTKTPYVVLKYAMTLDGKIATRTGASKWITGETAREQVHELRGRYAAIMAGIGTVLADDPMLNCRKAGGHQPLRVIADSRLRLPLESRLVRTAREYPTVVACGTILDPQKALALREAGVEIWELPDAQGKVDLRSVMKKLAEEKVDSVLLEGGGTLHEAALKAGIVQHVCAYVAPKLFGGRTALTPVEGGGIEKVEDAFQLKNLKISRLGEDILLEGDLEEA